MPVTVSSHGRRHADTTKTMDLAARKAARYRGMSSHKGLLKRWLRFATAGIWRRAAKMVHQCLPAVSDASNFMVNGEVDVGKVVGAIIEEDLADAEDATDGFWSSL